MSISKQWYAVYTRPKAQKKVCELLTKKRIECFCPLNYLARQTGEKGRIYNDPLFNGYIFVKAEEEKHVYITQIEGVINMVYWLGLPATFKDNEVNMLKHVLNEYYNIRLEKVKVNANDQMIILEDEVKPGDNFAEARQLKVYLPSMGYALIADLKSPEGRIINLAKQIDKPQRAII